MNRVEHVGSFVRPEALLNAARARKAGTIDEREFRQVQDAAIHDIVRFQESIGLPSITDGEFRRRSWSAGFIDAVDGFALRDGTLGFRNETQVIGVASSPYAKAKLRRRQRIVADDFRFLKSTVRTGQPKVTIAAPDVMHFFLGPRSADEKVYPDIEQFYSDLVAIYREEIKELAALGLTYLQLDDTALPCNCDVHARADVKARGEDPDRLTERYVRLANDVLAACPGGMAKAIHMCRGNLRGQWMAEGGYEPIAERVFNELAVDAFLLEFDSPRAGDFRPLRFLPKGKKVVLGLVSTKTPALESKDALKRRVEEAAKHVPLEQLGISPQCGFSSVAGSGQPITGDDQKRKLELVLQVAAEVWR